MSSPERKGKTMDVLEPTQDFYGDLEVNRVGITKNFSVRWKFKIDNRKLTIENGKNSQSSTGCCPNGNPFERSLKRFLPTNLGEAQDKRCQLFEP